MALRRKYGWVAVLFLLSGIVYAKDPKTCPESGTQVFLGLDDTSAPTQVADGRAQDIQNVLLDVSRSLEMRHGVKVVGNTCDIPDEAFPPITGIYHTQFSSGTNAIVRTCSSRFQALSGSTWANATTSGTVVVTGGQNNQFVWTVGLDNIIGTNDVDIALQYNGSTVSRVLFNGLTNSISKAKTVAFFKNYLLFFNITEGGTDYPTRFRWSNVGTIGSWQDVNYIDIGALGGQEINAVAELYDNLYVFLTNSIYKISLVGGADTWNVSKVSDDVGCIAKNSIQSVTLSNSQNGLLFLDRNKKVYFFNGIYPRDISPLITVAMGALASSRLPYAVSGDTGTDYWLCTDTGTASTNDLCFDMQYQIGEWTKHTNILANAMGNVIDSASLPQVYFGSYKGLTYQLSDSTLRGDVGIVTGTVVVVNTYTTSTASGLQILYDSSQNMTAGAFIGAPIELVGGAGSGLTGTIADNTSTGLVVMDAFSATPNATTQYEVGAIDAFYTSKWYDVGYPAKLKEFGEVFFWADADVTSTHSVSYATDFNADISTISINLTPSATDATWGSTTWGTPLWGTVDNVFRQVKLESQGRFVKIKFAEDDPNEIFRIYGWSLVYWDGSEL